MPSQASGHERRSSFPLQSHGHTKECHAGWPTMRFASIRNSPPSTKMPVVPTSTCLMLVFSPRLLCSLGRKQELGTLLQWRSAPVYPCRDQDLRIHGNCLLNAFVSYHCFPLWLSSVGPFSSGSQFSKTTSHRCQVGFP